MHPYFTCLEIYFYKNRQMIFIFSKKLSAINFNSAYIELFFS